MNYSVDQINESIAVLENITTGEKLNVNLNKLPPNVKEGNIITVLNDTYTLNEDEEIARRIRIANKLNRLKQLNKNSDNN